MPRTARDTIQPRLRAMNADLQRIFLLKSEGNLTDLLCLPGQTSQLEKAMAQTQARMVILDPVISFLDTSVSDASNQSVRRALQPLTALAEKYDALILLIRHLNKPEKSPVAIRSPDRALTGPGPLARSGDHCCQHLGLVKTPCFLSFSGVAG